MSVLHGLAAAALGRLDPETAHGLTLDALAAGLGPVEREPDDPILATTLCGLTLANPVGLAAGFDKDARAPRALLAAGFGWVECGTVTPRPQAGNPRPRLFRLRADRAVINRLGFNNAGVDAFAQALGHARRRGGTLGPIGANIGANKDSADRVADYVSGLQSLWPLADYFTLNVSSPNTPGLRDLQHAAALAELLGAVAAARAALAAGPAGERPVFLKIAPDLTDEEASDIVAAALRFGLDGLIVSNTTLARPADLTDRQAAQAGGLSGAPLRERSTRLLAEVRAQSQGRLALIGVGGIASGRDAYAKIRAGAQAVQLYTALALQGPGLVRRIKAELAACLRADGVSRLGDAVGTA